MDANPTVITVRNNTENALCFETHAERRLCTAFHALLQVASRVQSSWLCAGALTAKSSGHGQYEGQYRNMAVRPAQRCAVVSVLRVSGSLSAR
jgi:hypothetical protein